jgi:hypothetical protein
MAMVKGHLALVGGALLAALIAADNVVLAASCTDRSAKGGCRTSKTASGSVGPLSFVQPSKPKPATHVHKATNGASTARSKALAQQQAGPEDGVARGDVPGPKDIRVVEKKDSTGAAAREPTLASSSSVPLVTGAAPVELKVPSKIPAAVTALSEGNTRQEAAAIPGMIEHLKGPNDVDLTVGSASLVSARPPTPDRSWLQGLLVVLGGALAAVSITRLAHLLLPRGLVSVVR